MTITGRYLDIGGTRTFVDEAGSGQPILMLPSAGRDSRLWHGVMGELADRYTMYAVDLPGHGKSWPLPGPRCLQTAEEYAEFIDRLLDALQLEQVVVTGFSLGGNMCLLYGATRPDRCLALVPMEASDNTPTHSAENLALLQHPRVSPAHYLLGQATTLAGTAADQAAREFNEWYGHTIVGVTTRADLEIYSMADSRALMPQIRCPVLMLRGEQDWIVPQRRVDDAASRITSSRHLESRTLPGVGHFPPLEAPALVASHIAQFLGAVVGI